MDKRDVTRGSAKPADRSGFDSRSKAVYMDDETGQAYIKVEPCGFCRALVQVGDKEIHLQSLHAKEWAEKEHLHRPEDLVSDG